MSISNSEIFAIPVFEKFLIYSPLQRISALVNRSAAEALRDCEITREPQPIQIRTLLDLLQNSPAYPPSQRQGILNNPLFLGIIPTRSCNLNCVYCDFVSDQKAGPPMSIDMAKQAIDAYFQVLKRGKHPRADIQFFGGEPLRASDVIYFSVAYAEQKARQFKMDVHFEVTTNGMFSLKTAEWISDHFDAVILSLDGPADIQESQRPARNKNLVFPTVFENAKAISSSGAELILRVCVSQKTVKRVPEIATWMANEFYPKAVCFETLQPTPQSKAAGLSTPDPIEFARQFHVATQALEARGIMAVHSTTNINECHLSLCPVGKDALIVSPDGAVDACYLPEHTWRNKGLRFRFGKIKNGKLFVDKTVLESVRNENVDHKPGCANCLCRYHCAGGCHVRHNHLQYSSRYDDHCIQTRAITIGNILRQLDQSDLATKWLTRDQSLEIINHRTSDRLRDLV